MTAGLASPLQGTTCAAVAAKRGYTMPMWGQPVQRSAMAAKIRFANRQFHLPQSTPIRLGLGILLIAGGLVGFLPVVGFWMIPLGLLVLSVDIPAIRRWRRKLAVWWHRRKEKGALWRH